jgi:glycogen operon protein
LLTFTRLLIELRHRHPVLRRRKFFQGRSIRGEIKDLTWFRPDGKEMTDEDWGNPLARCLGLRLAGDAIDELDDRGHRITDDTLLILLNAHHEPVPFILPAHRARIRWELILDTREPTGRRRQRPLRGGEAYDLEARSLVLLSLRREELAVEEAESTLRGQRRPRLRRAEDL